MKLKRYLNEEIVNLLITYPKAKELGIEKEVEKIFLDVVPLPKDEKVQVIKGWKSKHTTLVMIPSKEAGKYKKQVQSFIKRMYEMSEIRDGDWVRMSNAQKMKNIPKPKYGVSAFEDEFKKLKKKRDTEGLKKLRQVSKNVGHNNIVNMIDKYLNEKTESEWYNQQDDDTVKVEKRKGNYYGAGDKFDFERKSKKEIYNQLKKWGYKKS
jgi:hypothetical protein